MRQVAIIQSRLGSSRLPGKSLMDLGGRPVLAWVVAAARAVPGLDAVAVATSDRADDDPIAAWCAEAGVACHRGPENDVLARYALAARAERADVVMRLTGDCPLLDPAVCDQVLALRTRSGADYASNVDPHTWPHGLDCEAFTAEALFAAEREARLPTEREHVTPFLRAHRDRFHAANLPCPIPGLRDERWTLDHAEDLALLQALVARLPLGRPASYPEVLRVLDAEPGLRGLNAAIGHDEGWVISLLKEPPRLLPAAPPGLRLSHAHRGRCWDGDGVDYVDLTGRPHPLLYGQRDPEIDDALRRQLGAGTGFAAPTFAEERLVDRLRGRFAGAEQAILAADGDAAAAAAIDLARAATGHRHLLVLDDAALPAGETAAERIGPAELARHLADPAGPVAAVILDPADWEAGPPPDLATTVHAAGALLLYDGRIAALRLAALDRPHADGPKPDLLWLGESLAHGLPWGAVLGRADLLIRPSLPVARPAGGALAVAAAHAVLDKADRTPPATAIARAGQALAEGIARSLAAHGLGGLISLRGPAGWTRIGAPPALASRLSAELRRARLLCDDVLAVTAAHDAADIALALAAWDRAATMLSETEPAR
ncbi:MAG: hypothetical protein RLZZ501_837 [Pseudomonadota bacterium]|jgi:glutamate-1-semialdehyde 2,1-aminomutase/spore coat polysaccharide biosynthesis protein SpsF